MKFDIGIIGGGLSGICSALFLSKKYPEKKIILIDENPKLGGRLFSFEPLRTGIGFELLNNETQKNLEAWFLKHFYDHEIQKWQPLVSLLPERNFEKSLFIKKEILNKKDFFRKNNEFCTKKEIDLLHSLFQTEIEKNEQNSLPFFKHPFFFSLDKETKKTFEMILKTTLLENVLDLPFFVVAHQWKQFWESENFEDDNHSISPCFQKKFELETFLEKLLMERNVDLLFRSRVNSLAYANGFELVLQSQNLKFSEKLLCTKMIVTVPLIHTTSFLPREYKTPSQSKYSNQYPPRSVLYYEIHCPENKETVFQKKSLEFLNGPRHLYFPQERCKAFITTENSILFYCSMEYENSFASSVVRENLVRLKKAFSRLCLENFEKENKETIKKQDFFKKNYEEKVTLSSLGYDMSAYFDPKSCVNSIAGKIPGLFFCGENYYSCEENVVARILKSVETLP